jgi:hypothetical protein
MVSKWIPVLGLVLSSAGCGSGRDMLRPATEFPERAKLLELAQGPVKKRDGQRVIPVNQWSLDDSLYPAAQTEPAPEQVPWIRLLARSLASAQGRVEASRSLHCTAGQVGRFVQHHGGLPDQRLLQFMAARCGSTVATPQAELWNTEVEDSVSNAELVRQWGESLRRDIARG